MTEKSQSGAEENASIVDEQSDFELNTAPEEPEKVGRGRPPRKHQFKKGKSGNPKGAKRKATSTLPDLKKTLEQALERKITVMHGEKKRRITLFQAGIEQLAKQFVKGDRHARREVFEMVNKFKLNMMGDQKTILEEPLTRDLQKLLYTYVEKNYDLVKPKPPVLAPPALLDDAHDEENEG